MGLAALFAAKMGLILSHLNFHVGCAMTKWRRFLLIRLAGRKMVISKLSTVVALTKIAMVWFAYTPAKERVASVDSLIPFRLA